MKQSYEVALWFCSSMGEHFPGGYVAPDYVGRIKAHSELEAALLFMSGYSLDVPVVYVRVTRVAVMADEAADKVTGVAGMQGVQAGEESVGSCSVVLRFESGAVAGRRAE